MSAADLGVSITRASPYNITLYGPKHWTNSEYSVCATKIIAPSNNNFWFVRRRIQCYKDRTKAYVSLKEE